MKVALIDPKRINLETYLIIPNLGLAYLATALRRAGHDPYIVNAARDALLPDKVAEMIAAGGYGMAGIHVNTAYFSSAAAYARAIKKRCPGIKLVAGGPHAIFLPEEIYERIPEFDYVVNGEGEETLPALVSLIEQNPAPTIDSLRAIPNMVINDNGRIEYTPRKIIDDIKTLDQPAWDLLQPNSFSLYPNGIFTMKSRIAPTITTRGCPFACTYCGAGTAMGKRLRHRDPESVADTFEILRKEYNIPEVHIFDDNFVCDRNFAVQVCEAIIRRKLDVLWGCTTGIRLDGFDEELVKLMRRAGCYSTGVGIESGSQRVLELMKKKLDLKVVPERIDMLRRNGLRVTGFFILGFPGETIDDMKQTVELALRLNLNRANFFNFTPFPGSCLYDQLKAEGRLEKLDYDEMYIHSLSYCHHTINPKQLIRMQRSAHFRFYLRPKIMFRLLKEIHSYTQVRIIFKRAMKIIFPGKKDKIAS